MSRPGGLGNGCDERKRRNPGGRLTRRANESAAGTKPAGAPGPMQMALVRLSRADQVRRAERRARPQGCEEMQAQRSSVLHSTSLESHQHGVLCLCERCWHGRRERERLVGAGARMR